MRLLITGATGFLGSSLVKHFADCTEFTNILATGRKLAPEKTVNAPHVQYILGDLTSKTFVKSLFNKQIDIVINCASLSSPWGSYQSFYRSNCITQRHLIEQSRAALVKRFIYISTPSIYFDFQDAYGITENTPLPKKMVNDYAITKWEAEKTLEKSTLSYIILRPRALIGRGDTVIMPRLIRSYLEGRLKIIGSGKNIVDLTSITNMVQAVKLAVTTAEENSYETYNISNGEPVNLWESINLVLTLLGYARIEKKLPYALLYGLAYFLELKTRFFKSKKEPVLTRYSVGVLAKSFTFDIEKAKNKLNYQPIQSTKQAIEEFAQWYKK